MFLGIDIGTSNVKAVLADEAQRIVASASAPIPISRPHELWSEQNPDDWWAATEAAVAEVRRSAGEAWAKVRAIGLSGQMHGAVLLDAAGVPLRPAILHNDGRSHVEAKALNEKVPGFGAIAGVPAMAGFLAPKLLWMKAHEPDILRQTAHVLLPKDYVRFRMTGSYATDMSDGSGAVLLDTGARQWSNTIIEACGIAPSILPPVLEGPTAAGMLQGAVAQAFGLHPGIVVAAGSGDAAAGAIGLGAVNDGDAFISLGTASQYFITRDSYRPKPEHLIHTFCHGLPGRWFQMAAILNGASALAWAAGVLKEPDIGKLLGQVEAQFRGPSPITFLPYLTGERTPHNNPHAKGVLFGMTAGSSAIDIAQAAIEGINLSLADCQSYLAETGPLPDAIGVNGGGSRNRFWMRLLASTLKRTVVLYEGGEAGPAFGAARLARLAVTAEEPAQVCTKPAIAAEIAPDPALSDAYSARLERFRALYRATAPLF